MFRNFALVAAVLIGAVVYVSGRDQAGAQSAGPVLSLAAKAAQAVGKSIATARTGLPKIPGIMKRNYQKLRDIMSGGGSTGAAKTAGNLKVPKDYCPLSRDAAKEVYDQLDEVYGKEVTTAQYSLPCNALPEFWQGKDAQRWSVYTIDNAMLPVEVTRTVLVVELTKMNTRVKLEELNKYAKRKPIEERSGLIEASPEAIYQASISADVSGRPFAHVIAVTIIARRVVLFHFYSTHQSARDFEDLLAMAKDVVGRSIEASDQK
jgi:hypothetical protein